MTKSACLVCGCLKKDMKENTNRVAVEVACAVDRVCLAQDFNFVRLHQLERKEIAKSACLVCVS